MKRWEFSNFKLFSNFKIISKSNFKFALMRVVAGFDDWIADAESFDDFFLSNEWEAWKS